MFRQNNNYNNSDINTSIATTMNKITSDAITITDDNRHNITYDVN